MWTGNLLRFPVLHFRSKLFPVIVLHPLDQLIEDHGDRAQDDDGGDYHVELEDLRPIDDQIPEPPSGSEEFTDNDTHQRQPDIDFHIT